MMTARQFAEKYPEHVVRITDEFAKSIEIDQVVLGKVVGYRTGTMGIIGSSKVAIWRGDIPLVPHLAPHFNFDDKKSYHSVVLTTPNYMNGIYYMSVSSIELITAKKKNIVEVYPNHCSKCGCAARIGRSLVICSNAHCKTNKSTIKTIGGFIDKLPKVVDSENFVICPTCKSRDIEFNYGNQTSLVCAVNKLHKWEHVWKEGQNINYRGSSVLTWHNLMLRTAAYMKSLKGFNADAKPLAKIKEAQPG